MSLIEKIGGVTVADPFRWLEEDDDPAVQSWQNDQDGRATKELTNSPRAAFVRDAVEATFEDVFAYTAPQRHGPMWFWMCRPAGSTSARLEVADSPGGEGRVLVDPAEEGPHVTVVVWVPSRDGKKVVVGTSEGGPLRLRVIDVTTGATSLDLGERIGTYFFAWSSDDSGFFHQSIGITQDPDGGARPVTEIWWQPLDGPAVLQDITVDHPAAWPTVSADGRWTAVVADQTAPRPRWVRFFDGDWQPFLTDVRHMYKGSFVGDEYWAITDDRSGWCRLVAIPVSTADDLTTWRELVPAREGTKLTSLTPCGDFVALTVIEGGVMKLRSLDTQGCDRGEVPLPSAGAVGRSGIGHAMSSMVDVVNPDGNGCVFVHSSLDRSPGIYRADLERRTVTELKAPAHVLRDRTIESHRAPGPQGSVLYRVMRKSATPLDGTAPVLVTGYGGFNVPWIPCYSAMAAAWTEMGGVWVHTHLRGGGEQDSRFWQQGRMHRKQGTFDDLYAVLDDLYHRGAATPSRTGLWGSSNGGLLVGAAVTQRPSLIRAAVAQVPILDLMQCRKDPGTIGVVMADYGNPDDPADAPVMHSYSPYHNVPAATAFPAVLLDAGANDPSCPAWHSRKMTAALQAATTSDNRILLRVRHGSGHNQMTTQQAMERDVEELTFLTDELLASA